MLTLVGCATQEQQIKKAAYNYSYALANYDISSAEPYCTPETQQTALAYAKAMLPNVDSSYIRSDTPGKIEITAVKMQSDTTAIVTYHKTTPVKDFVGELEMRKRGEQWLAHAPIATQAAPSASSAPIRTIKPEVLEKMQQKTNNHQSTDSL